MAAHRSPAGLPGSFLATSSITRRTLFRGLAVGGGLAATLAACGDGDSGGGSGPLRVGINEAPGSGRAYDQQKARLDAFTEAELEVNYVDHNTFQEGINNYLQGSPADVFTWFAGYRARSFYTNGLIGDVSDAYPADVSEAIRKASTADDGKQIFVPTNNYPWAVFYFKSLWEKNGYEPPATLDELVTLSRKMQGDGLTPIGFADKDGWPAMGTFDILNMRINGYDFHMSLMAGQNSWTDPKVKTVFDTWRGLLPYHQSDSLGRTYQEAVSSLQQKKSGMYYLGLFLTDSLEIEEQEDIAFFTFPEIDSTVGADAIDAPIDGFCRSAAPRNEGAATDLLKYLGSGDSGSALDTAEIPQIATNAKATTGNYTDLQQRAVEFMGTQKSIAQFMDRDTDPGFASTVMIPAIQTFIKNPDDVDGLLKSIDAQAKSIFVS
ncbi:ABC transporter substrate-binding protein [Kineosporia succinea]|uniref:Multiple sugar transport system substrate-binding protein n=1 Tax=Kineosporia succinea TaxID=84632 RepID=A0ABT9PEQ7_9ACTN|nr:ABC transporter substrate-binding protein [Kineosporia succinea]MDP9831189.1 multiple sugar transport system substrate-binding protein [Kineosporia succinea]